MKKWWEHFCEPHNNFCKLLNNHAICPCTHITYVSTDTLWRKITYGQLQHRWLHKNTFEKAKINLEFANAYWSTYGTKPEKEVWSKRWFGLLKNYFYKIPYITVVQSKKLMYENVNVQDNSNNVSALINCS